MESNLPNNPILFQFLEEFGLDGSRVERFTSELIAPGKFVHHIWLSPSRTPCPECGQEKAHICGYVAKRITHNILQFGETVLIYHQRRYRCPRCHKTWSDPNPFVFKKQRISMATVISILEDLKNPNLTYSDIAEKHKVSPTTVRTILDNYVHFDSLRPLPRILLIDEVYAFKSDNSGYVCVILDGETGIPVDILPNRLKRTVEAFFRKYPKEERDKVLYFCSDMYKPYQDVGKKLFPNAIHGVDRFHVSQQFEQYFNTLRKRIMRGAHLESDEYYLLKHQNGLLNIRPDARIKNSRELVLDPFGRREFNRHFRKNMNKFELLSELLAVSGDLETGYGFKNELGRFFRECTLENAQQVIEDMINRLQNSPIEEMQNFAGTLKRWEKEIVNSFHVTNAYIQVSPKSGKARRIPIHLNSGLIENRNRVIQKLKNNANGFSNWERFRKRVLYVLDPNAAYRID